MNRATGLSLAGRDENQGKTEEIGGAVALLESPGDP